MYLDAVEQSVAKTKMKDTTFSPNVCDIQENGKLICDKDTDKEKEVEVEVKGETPTSGTIIFQEGNVYQITLEYNDNNIIVKDSDGNLAYEKKFNDICTWVSGTKNKAGAKYSCEVKPETNYNFFVLTTPEEGASSINLIMDRNICDDGTLTASGKTCLLAWMNETDYLIAGGTNWSGNKDRNMYGPVTAMNYLYNATKDWTNIPNIQMNYNDEGNEGSYGYGKIITTGNITKITKKDNTPVTVLTDKEGYINLKARLPYYNEISNYDSTNKNNAYLYNYLKYGQIQTNVINGIYGYWTLSTRSGVSSTAGRIGYDGYVNYLDVKNSTTRGVRPVISLKI